MLAEAGVRIVKSRIRTTCPRGRRIDSRSKRSQRIGNKIRRKWGVGVRSPGLLGLLRVDGGRDNQASTSAAYEPWSQALLRDHPEVGALTGGTQHESPLEEDVTLHVERGLVYDAPDRLVDVYLRQNAESDPVMLLWHGSGPDERTVLEPLARATAELGVVAFVPDWRSDAPDEGRAHLLASIAFLRARAQAFCGDPHRVLLTGWSRGGRAAAGIAVDVSAADGWRPSAVACLATSYGRPTPTSAKVPLEAVANGDPVPIPFWLVHGLDDEVVDVEHSREFARVLRDHAWPVHLHELETNHAGVVMTQYDATLRRCVPATGGHALEAGRRVAAILARAARETCHDV